MTRYVVIENTPGYLPEEDDPYVTEDYAAACAYLLERVEQYMEFVSEGGGEPASTGDSTGSFAYVTDMSREHDLGRNFSVEVCED